MRRTFVVVDDDLDMLFRVEPDSFTAARDALVKTFRASKRRDEASTLAKLRRPTNVVWAMNQVARLHSELVAQLLIEGAAAVKAQGELLTGGPIAALHEAVERRQSIVHQLVNESLAMLEAKGMPTQNLGPQLRSAFETASIEPEYGPKLLGRRLTTMPAPVDDNEPFPLRMTGPTQDAPSAESEPRPATKLYLVAKVTATDREETDCFDHKRAETEQHETEQHETEQRETEQREHQQREHQQREAERLEQATAQRRVAEELCRRREHELAATRECLATTELAADQSYEACKHTHETLKDTLEQMNALQAKLSSLEQQLVEQTADTANLNEQTAHAKSMLDQAIVRANAATAELEALVFT